MPAPMRCWLRAGIWAVLSGLGCSEARLVDALTDGPTLIRVAPGTFTGSVACARGATGALQSYVVSLVRLDQNGQPADAGYAGDQQISPPVPCEEAVVFPVLANGVYAADISGFDRDIRADEVGTAVPRWTSSCGRGGGAVDAGVDPFAPTQAIRSAIVPLRGCVPFGQGSVVSPGRLVVDTTGALGRLSCGTGAGQVAFFEASLDGQRYRARCGDRFTVAVSGSPRFRTLELTGFEAALDGDGGVVPSPPTPDTLDAGVADAADAGDAATVAPPAALDAASSSPAEIAPDGGTLAPVYAGTPRWRASCVGRSLAGIDSPTTCEPLAPLLVP
jgi:hypothetical protein